MLVQYTFLSTFSLTRSRISYIKRCLMCFGPIDFAEITSKMIFGHIFLQRVYIYTARQCGSVSCDVTAILQCNKTRLKDISQDFVERMFCWQNFTHPHWWEGKGMRGSQRDVSLSDPGDNGKTVYSSFEIVIVIVIARGRRVKNTDKYSFKLHTSARIIYTTHYCIRLSALSDCVSVL